MTPNSLMDAALHLTGLDVCPDDITQFLSLVPTKTWRRGDRIGQSSLKRNHDGWVFAVQEKQTRNLEDVLVALLDVLQPFRDRIVEAAGRFHLETEVSCTVYFHDDTPIEHISIETLRRITALGADLDIDLIID